MRAFCTYIVIVEQVVVFGGLCCEAHFGHNRFGGHLVMVVVVVDDRLHLKRGHHNER